MSNLPAGYKQTEVGVIPIVERGIFKIRHAEIFSWLPHRRHPLRHGRRNIRSGNQIGEMQTDQAGDDAEPLDREDTLSMKENQNIE